MYSKDSLALAFIALFYSIGVVSFWLSVRLIGHGVEVEMSDEDEEEDHIHNYLPSTFVKLDSVESIDRIKGNVRYAPVRQLEEEVDLSRSRIFGPSESSSSMTSPDVFAKSQGTL
ncbi:unnamed protein product [Bursaphelenchus okinawaensis]|uniref:Uncharacterized protein n=1 Tax=Bursaphelenchus okinawaensis TaxID=465554 RepID=A0A811JV95_9BILA|nr:unnamed protein product [Bursaphelenchus okinawaensis]CAG9085433.1 unnamed protein product [Bursaphelenchus okinawaensis]